MPRADPFESAAVLIGVSGYRTDFPDVPQAAASVRRLAEEFAAPEVWGLGRPSRLWTLVDPDRAAVLRSVGDAARLVRSPGLLLIYFVGHAESSGGQLCLCPVDGDRSRPESSMVTVAALADEVTRNAQRGVRTMLVLDCCFAGRAAGSIPMSAVPATEAAGWYFLGAVEAGKPADAGAGREVTRFTEKFLQVLQGLPDKAETLTPIDVFGALTALLPEHPPVHNNALAGTKPWLANRTPRPIRVVPAAVTAPATVAARRPRMVPPMVPGAVHREPLFRSLLGALTGTAHAEPVAVTAVHGTGGFGKTVLAIQACRDPSIDDRFPGGVVWTELGQGVDGPALASKINDVTERLTGTRPTLADPQAAGFQLGEALDAHADPILLVVDDVWRDEQIRPFLTGGPQCRRLVTSRVMPPALAAATVIPVDRMAHDEAAAVLTQGIDPIPAGLIARLLKLTCRWPLLLGIANRTIARSCTPARNPEQAAMLVIDRLAAAGPASLDNPWNGDAGTGRSMVAASINASLDSLPAYTRDRYRELGIFAEDTDIPYAVLALLWAETGGLDAFQTEQLGRTLIDASLATPARDTPGLRLHDVLRTYLRDTAGDGHRARTNGALITAAAILLADTGQPADGTDPHHARPWWSLPGSQHYLWQHLADHLTDAGLHTERDHLLIDLRWIAARIRRDGPVHAEADLTHTDHPDAAALALAIRCNAHLLTPINPPTAIDDILASRLDGNSIRQPHVHAFIRTLTHRPRIANHWPPPDQPDPALLRTIHTGHPDGVGRVQVASDGSWLATTGTTGYSGGDPVVRIWDLATGRELHQLATGHSHGVGQVYLASNGTWLATTGTDQFGRGGDPVVRIWDPATGRELQRLDTGHPDGVGQLHIAPDGTWLATTGTIDSGVDPVVRIWDPATGRELRQLDTGHPRGVEQVHIAPDGTWLATAGYSPGSGVGGDPVVRIWDPATGRELRQLDTGHPHGVRQVYLAPDGTWLATTDYSRDVGVPPRRHGPPDRAADGTYSRGGGDPVVRIWDPATGRELHQLDTGHPHGVGQLHFAPDGTWLATTDYSLGGGGDPVLRIWDPATGRELHQLDTGHPRGVGQLHTTPDGAWLATSGTADYYLGGGDPVVRIWDPAIGRELHQLDTGHPDGVGELHFAPDGTWLATTGYSRGGGGGDPVVRIWDPAIGRELHQLDTGHPDGVGQVYLALSGTSLATTGYSHGDPVVRIWDPAIGRELHQLDTGHPDGVGQLHFAPDGTWLATTGYSRGGGGGDPVVRIWDPATGRELHQLDTGHRGVEQVYLAPDGTWLATTGTTDRYFGGGDPVVRIWDPATGRELHQLDTGHPDGVGKMHIAPDGTWLATTGTTDHLGRGDGDPVVRIWDQATGCELHQLDTGHRHGVGQVYLAPDGTWLATTGTDRFDHGGDPVVRIWDPATGRELHQLHTGNRHGVGQVYLAPDGTWLATTGYSDGGQLVRIWDPATGHELHQLDTGHRGVEQMHIAPDGTWLATTGTDQFGRGGDPVVRIWDPATGHELQRLDTGHPGGLRQLHITQDSKNLVAIGPKSVLFWVTANWEMAAIRLDRSIGQSVLSAHEPLLFLGGVHGLYAFRLIPTDTI